MLIPCPECARQVSDRAKACPDCGFPVSEHVAEQRELARKQAVLASRERVGEIDCPRCEARGFVSFTETNEDGVTEQLFSWCSDCKHSGRVHQCRDLDGYYAVSFAALLVGAALLPVALRPGPIVTAALASLLVGTAVLLGRLRSASDARAEQVAIGLGARLGNGVLLVTLAWLVLGGAGASEAARVTFVLLLAALIGASVASLAGHPERVVIGYKA